MSFAEFGHSTAILVKELYLELHYDSKHAGTASSNIMKVD